MNIGTPMRAWTAAERLNALKRKIAAIEGARTQFGDRPALPFGIPAIDAALGGGLALGAVHELEAVGPAHRGAALGFAVALACGVQRTRRADVLWIETPFAAGETGQPYGLG